jgi:predicted HTH domain antitoxin
MKNVTLSAAADLIEQARLVARTQHKTLNAVFREWLQLYAAQSGSEQEGSMSTVQLELGQELLELLQSPDRPVQQSARELIILELYRQGRIAAGKAAELLGMGRSDFLQVASQAGVPYFEMTTQEWNEEISESRKI